MRTATLVAGTVAGVVIMAAPALAHVTVHADTTTPGSYAKLTFRVPTEVDNASTVSVQVTFPAQYPLPEVDVQPHAGWSFRVATTKLAKPITTDDGPVDTAVSTVTWTADSAADGIRPGEFDEFSVAGGPLPKAAAMRFPAVQTYSNGQVVRWIDVAAAGAPEPEHPVPTLRLGTPVDAAAPRVIKQTSGSDTVPLVLSIVALVVALGAAGLQLRRVRASQRS